LSAVSENLLNGLRRELHDPALTCHWLAGDGSDRSYFRIVTSDRSSLVLMQLSDSDTAKLRNNAYEWVILSEMLSKNGFVVPKLRCALPELRCIVIEDYGDLMLQDSVTNHLVEARFDEVEELYLGCADIISKFLKLPSSLSPYWQNRSFDFEKFNWELRFFVQQYLNPICSKLIPEAKLSCIQPEIDRLAEFTSSFSKYFVHRDFHSRNLMLFKDQIAVIDFQDGRLGPAAYDVVSLIFDSYVPLNADQRKRLLELVSARIKSNFDDRFYSNFDAQLKAVLLQRQLKAIGSFGYLTILKNKGNYLKYVHPAVNTLIEFNVFDERWSFLSGDLLQIISEVSADASK
jgi:aminoglycoside/choline kinase family phosphotransferase